MQLAEPDTIEIVSPTIHAEALAQPAAIGLAARASAIISFTTTIYAGWRASCLVVMAAADILGSRACAAGGASVPADSRLAVAQPLKTVLGT